MFRIETKADIRLVGRSMNDRWDVDKEKVLAALNAVVDSRDPDLMIPAAALLLKADELNAKREAIDAKRDGDDGDQRLRLLELAKRIPVEELARRAASIGIVGERRPGEPTHADGDEAGGTAGSTDTDSR